jgi:PucR C-terminal helix-turn-helix domain
MATARGRSERAAMACQRAEVGRRLRARRHEIERVVLIRIAAVAPVGEGDIEYAAGLRAAVGAATEYGIDALEVGEERAGLVPLAIVAQARRAARSRVSLETVLRRYFVGYTAIGNFLLNEASDDPLLADPQVLQEAQRELAAVFDRVVACVGSEYQEAAAEVGRGRETRRADRIRRLLSGDLLSTDRFNYDFGVWHVGMVVEGPRATDLLRDLATRLDRRLLSAESGEATIWAWLGGRRRPDPADVLTAASKSSIEVTRLAVGEAGEGMSGWLATHRQAQAGFLVGERRAERCIRYGDIGALASMLKDEIFMDFLAETYLAPLVAERDGGETMIRTLRAYFRANRNISSAAADLGVSRKTVNNRLRTIEERLGRSLSECSTELEAALKLEPIGPVTVSS